MKAFIISAGIFFAMIAMIVFNYIYINSTSDQLEELAADISLDKENFEDKLNALEKFWDKNKNTMDFTVNHTLISGIGIKITNIRLFADKHDDFQLKREVSLLIEEIKEMRRLECFSIKNIF